MFYRGHCIRVTKYFHLINELLSIRLIDQIILLLLVDSTCSPNHSPDRYFKIEKKEKKKFHALINAQKVDFQSVSIRNINLQN